MIENGQTLPAPTATLKYVTLGRGTQNYTCTSPSASPSAFGAKASLWDVSLLLAWIPAPWGLKAVLDTPRVAINVPIEKIPSVIAATAIGHHVFNSAGQPTFDLGDKGFLVGKKASGIAAPKDAASGPFNNPGQDYGAVDWLNLVDAGGSVGLTEVYRVECAGGKPPVTCDSAGSIYQEYSCLYWFYG